MSRAGTINRAMLTGKAVYRDHVIERIDGAYQVREHGDHQSGVLWIAGSVTACMQVIDEVMDDLDAKYDSEVES